MIFFLSSTEFSIESTALIKSTYLAVANHWGIHSFSPMILASWSLLSNKPLNCSKKKKKKLLEYQTKAPVLQSCRKAIPVVSSFRPEYEGHNFRPSMALPDVFGQVNHSLPEG